jgi:hypothetical protein
VPATKMHASRATTKHNVGEDVPAPLIRKSRVRQTVGHTYRVMGLSQKATAAAMGIKSHSAVSRIWDGLRGSKLERAAEAVAEESARLGPQAAAYVIAQVAATALAPHVAGLSYEDAAAWLLDVSEIEQGANGALDLKQLRFGRQAPVDLLAMREAALRQRTATDWIVALLDQLIVIRGTD